LRESISCPNCGRKVPTNKPATMQMAIHRVRYFSKIPRVALLVDEDACAQTKVLSLSQNVQFMHIFNQFGISDAVEDPFSLFSRLHEPSAFQQS